MRFFSFTLMIGAGAFLGHLYLYYRLVRPAVGSERWRRAIGLALIAMTAFLLLRRSLPDLGERFADAYAVVAYGWIAFGLSMVSAAMVGDSVKLVAALGARISRGRRRRAEDDHDPERRRFLTQALHVGVATGGALTAGYGSYRAFTPPEITEVAVRVAKLPRSLDGLTIVQLTDVHVGPFIGRRFIDQLVHEANALRPDLVAITGDLVDGDVARLGGAVAGLRNLRSRFGSFFVTGNHEYYSGELQWVDFLERLGVEVLRNRRVTIGDAGGAIDLVGVDDWSGGRRRGRQGYDLDLALADRDPERATVLLAHQPANFEVAASKGVDLQISGHTHGGQIFPATVMIGLFFDHVRGLYRHDESHLYVSRGCGFWGPPARVGSPPEIVKITLTT
ncbi:MAG: metallophosphoesterase [Sandaracinaceae bacterium]|nr:metallophosphoesterase [Sandaracinaceae bacterium]